MIYSLFNCPPYYDASAAAICAKLEEIYNIASAGYWSEDHNHYPLYVTKQVLSEDIYKKYFKFAFVRNPWDRVVSDYFYGLKWFKKDAHRKIPLPRRFSDGFENYIFSMNDWEKKSLICQSDFTEGSDFIGRFENLQEDFNYVCDEIGKPRTKLKRLNRSGHEQYREYYNKETGRAIAEKFAKDIEYFKYEY